jgi:hypothetical protein
MTRAKMVSPLYPMILTLSVLMSACGGSGTSVDPTVNVAQRARPSSAPSVSPASMSTHVSVADYGDVYINYTTTRVYNPADVRWLSLVEVGSSGSSGLDYSQYAVDGVRIAFREFAYGVVGGSNPQNPYYTYLGGQGSSITYQPSAGFAHTCSGDLLVDVEGHGTWLMVNWANPLAAAAFTKAYLANPPKMNAPIDYWYLDGSTHLSDYYDAVTGQPGVPCLNGQPATQASWDAATRPVLASLGIPIINDGGGQPQYIGPPFVGQREEGPYITGGEYIPPGYWQSSEDAELRMALAHAIWIAQNKDDGVYPTSLTGQAHRLFAFASFLLTYDLSTSYYWYAAHGVGIDNDPLNPSGEHIFPEEWFVPTNPVLPEPGDINQLRDSGGAYYREYKDCGYQGVRIGRCAVVVNPTLSSVPWPSSLTSYQNASVHQLVMHNGSGRPSQYCTPGPSQPCQGAEIPDGGYLTFDGPPAPASLPPESAIIVVNSSG